MGRDDVFVRRGGDGPALLLLHGLGATCDVWDGLIALLPGHWPGSWIAPDPPGHGRSAPAPRNRYSIGGLAAAVATVLEPDAFSVGAPAMDGLLAAARGAVVLAAGEHDPMSPVEHLQALLPDPVVLEGLGHNAHVEDPAALLPLIGRLATSVPGGG
jgi:pimeloyl-ACP methyl ester carboxylesterase